MGQLSRSVSDLLGNEQVEPTTPDPTLPLWIALPSARCLLSRWCCRE